MIDFLGRVLTTVAIGRHAAMRKAGVTSIRMARYSEQEVEDGWETYSRDCGELLREADQIGLETKSRPYSARVSQQAIAIASQATKTVNYPQIAAGRIMWTGSVTIWLSIDAQNTKANVLRVNQSVNVILETAIEALGRGMVTQ
jgi:hypothetical protein